MDLNVLNESRNELVTKLGIKDSVFDELMARHIDNGLAYHNLDHISDLLNQYKKFKHLADTHFAVQSAIWFHDAIHVSGDKDNELKSAELAEKTLLDNGLSKGFSKHVYEMIIDAVYGKNPTDKDTMLLRDIDFSILIQDKEKYDKYSKNIAAEYGFMKDDAFANGRKSFLEKILNNDIFLTKEFKELYEDKARENILWEIEKINSYLKYEK
jgi:predicted metal-dependent HD superfamily phosphohydrolase